MPPRPQPGKPGLSDPADALPITEVERLSGIRQATLRMWEKRYGFPQPLRDRHGDRVYPLAQVERLQLVRRLIMQGYRPGKILCGGAAGDEVHEALPAAADVPVCAQHQHVFNLLRSYRRAELHSHFQYRLLDLGLRRFVLEFLAPLTSAVGHAWSRGALPVRCEHLFTQVVKSMLHTKQAAVRTAGEGRPKIVLGTLTGEQHTLGIMMAEAVMAALGMDCLQLGADTPMLELAAAAAETGADIAALSFSSYFPRKSVPRLLATLRSALPPSVELWIGGDGVAGVHELPAGVHAFESLDAIEPAAARWRAAHATV